MDLDALLDALGDLHAENARDPLAAIRWMVPQDAFLRLDGRSKAYRAGNQALGKSTVGLASVLMHCRGVHPYHRVRPPPVHWVICSLNQQQSIAIQRKFHALVGSDELTDECAATYSEKWGYGANKPTTQFRNGSIIQWVTDDQGPRAVAGATLDGVLVDEPCSPEMLRELQKRLLRRNGYLLLTFTPINGPTAHLREAIEAGHIAEIHAPLTLENLRFADTGEQVTLDDGTPCDQAFIDEIWRRTPGLYADIVNNGGWETAVDGVFFENFDPKRHGVEQRFRPGVGDTVGWYVGFDYAAADRDFGQVAVLVQVLTRRPKPGSAGLPEHWIHVAEEVVVGGRVDPDAFVDQLVGALGRRNLEWPAVQSAHGDNPVSSKWQVKSNAITMRALSNRLRVPQASLRPRILNAKEGIQTDRSRDQGCRWLFSAIGRDRVTVSPRCPHLAKALQTWDYSPDHPYKDVIDALRYALKPFIFPRGVSKGAELRFVA